MKLEECALIFEIVGGVAIVVSLVFVGVSIQQNTRAVRLSTAQNFQADFRQHELLAAANGELQELLVRANSNDELTPAENQRVRIYISAIMRAWANAYYQYKNGVLDEALWEGQTRRMVRTWRDVFQMRSWWETEKDLFEPGFVHFIEPEIANQ